ncbi:KR domain-containing protein, partial [Streptomyces sp. WAC05292]
MSIVVAGATGALGRLVVEELLRRVPAAEGSGGSGDDDAHGGCSLAVGR